MSALAPALQAYFTDRLMGQRQASPNTIAAYRHTFRLLLRFATERTGTQPSDLDIAALDAPLVAAFLEHLEQERGNSTATRNNRLAAIHSLFAYLALHHPSTPPRSSGYSRSRPNGPSATCSPTSPSPRSTRCSPPAIRPPGPAGATTRRSRSPSKRDFGSPS
jgi:integrase